MKFAISGVTRITWHGYTFLSNVYDVYVCGWQPNHEPELQDCKCLSSALKQNDQMPRMRSYLKSGLTPSLPGCYLKTNNKSGKFKIIPHFFDFVFRFNMWKDFHQNAKYWNEICYRTGNLQFAGVCVWCTFQPGSFTCWGSDGVHFDTATEELVSCPSNQGYSDLHLKKAKQRHYSILQYIIAVVSLG